MMFGGSSLGSVGLGSVHIDPGAIVDPTSLRPILTELNGVDVRAYVLIDTFSKQDTIGQPVSASLTFVNTPVEPQTGDEVRVRFHESVEFAGTISRVKKRSPDLSTVYYDCELVDWSQILMRRLVRRNFTDMTVHAIVDSILDNELAGEEITIGDISSLTTVPLVDASAGSRVFDLLRDLAGATGQTFFVDFNKAIQMRGTPSTWDRGTSVLSAFAQDFILDESGQPILDESGNFILEEEQEGLQTLNEATVLLAETGLVRDRETYRNVQTVIVTGTPQVENEDALSVTVQRTNEDEIAARQAIEGGTGRYEALDEIVHPTSNRLDDLLLLGNGFGDLKLSASGTLRTVLTVQVRGYGFRAGQVGTVNLPTFGVVGEFMLQRVTLKEVAAQHFYYTLELTESSAQQRAYESWLSILSKGKIAIQLFGAVVHDSVTFTTPGAHNWVVPAGVTVITITIVGASGGGGGGALYWSNSAGPCIATTIGYTGGKGGNGGKVVSSVSVVTGDEINLVIVGNGNGGTGGRIGCTTTPTSTNGTAGLGATTAHRGGISLAEAYHGGGGYRVSSTANGAAGTPGGGSGGIVTVGGGKTGGAGGGWLTAPSNVGANGSAGGDGKVTIEW